jgi:fermentation-respiration switch protein FrsA (DUF1100 family)
MATVYLPVVAVILFLLIRQLEFMATYRPKPYAPGPDWTPPVNCDEVWVEIADGQRVHGWFMHAQAQPAIATVLYCHGNATNLVDAVWVARTLSERHLDVMIFDYRGYGRSQGKLTDEWGLYADTDAVYNYLVNQRGVRPERLVIYGESLGTTAAIDVASRRPCQRLIVEAGLSSASDMGAVKFPWLPSWLHWMAKNRFDSVRKIAAAKCPVLVAHGTNDAVIPIEQGRKLYEAAREPKRLIIVPDGDHNLFGSGGNDYLEKIIEFIRESAMSTPGI